MATYDEWLGTARELAGIWADRRNATCGVRVLHDAHKRPRMGKPEDIANSYDWYEEEYGSGERIELDGACAIAMGDAGKAKDYMGRYVVLLAGTDSSVGTDAGETIIRNARAVALFDRETGETEEFA